VRIETVRVVDNRYSLGLRSVSELAPYIEAEFGEHAVPECVCCSHFVVRGPRCPTAQCTAILHRRCAVDWFSQAVSCVCLLVVVVVVVALVCSSLFLSTSFYFDDAANCQMSLLSKSLGIE